MSTEYFKLRAPYTPAPWGKPYKDKLGGITPILRIDSKQSEGVSVIASLHCGDEKNDPEIFAIQEANAQLIHKAPDMLALLQRLVTNLEFDNPDIIMDILGREAQELIEEATTVPLTTPE